MITACCPLCYLAHTIIIFLESRTRYSNVCWKTYWLSLLTMLGPQWVFMALFCTVGNSQPPVRFMSLWLLVHLHSSNSAAFPFKQQMQTQRKRATCWYGELWLSYRRKQQLSWPLPVWWVSRSRCCISLLWTLVRWTFWIISFCLTDSCCNVRHCLLCSYRVLWIVIFAVDILHHHLLGIF